MSKNFEIKLSLFIEKNLKKKLRLIRNKTQI